MRNKIKEKKERITREKEGESEEDPERLGREREWLRKMMRKKYSVDVAGREEGCGCDVAGDDG